jgi:hypothetical protein
MHPNFEVEDEVGRKSQVSGGPPKKRSKVVNGCAKTLLYLDAVVLKPLILYNYDPEGHKRIR